MASSPKKPSPLDQLLARYVDSYFGRPVAATAAVNFTPALGQPEWETTDQPPGRWHGETRRVLRDVAAAIYEKHLIGAPFRGSDEVSRVLARVVSDEKLWDQETEKICGRLLAVETNIRKRGVTIAPSAIVSG